MKVLVIGSGAREHALVQKLAESGKLGKIFCAPGNPGIGMIAELLDIAADNVSALADWAESNDIGLTVVGPEVPLEKGISDEFARRGLRIFGPRSSGARLESSKAFSKEFMEKYAIPTAKYAVYSDYDRADAGIAQFGFPVVIKADGLAAGKGVIIAQTESEARQALKEILCDQCFGSAGSNVVVEEFLDGREVSMLAFCDGSCVRLLDSARDYKRALDGDQGLNTGGMGAVSPVADFDAALRRQVEEQIAARTLGGLIAEGIDYQGVLYFGLMITANGPKVLEYNCRFGDPETEVLLPRLQSDLLEIMLAVCDKRLEKAEIIWKEQAAVCVVLASGGYPGGFVKGHEISLPETLASDVRLFHAGTGTKDGLLVNNGGRVLVASALGVDVESARAAAYSTVAGVSWKDMFYRKDIGSQGDL